MNLHEAVAHLRNRVALLEAKVGPIISSNARISTAALVGVLPSHTHAGTGQGGATLSPITLRLPATASDPSYVDGYAIIYFYSSGGTQELRVRGKVAATETQVTLADLSP